MPLFYYCSPQSNYQSTQGAQIFLRSNTSQSEATFVRRDFVTTLVQTWLTCWLSLQPFVALQCQTEHSSVIWFDQNSGFLLEPPFHILSLIFSRARHWRHWGSWLLPPRSFPYDPLPRHAAWNCQWYWYCTQQVRHLSCSLTFQMELVALHLEGFWWR